MEQPSYEVTVLNPSDLLGNGKTCFSQKRYGRVIDWFREIRHAHQWEFEEHSWRWNNIASEQRERPYAGDSSIVFSEKNIVWFTFYIICYLLMS